MSMSPTGPDRAEHTKHGYGWIDDLDLKATIAQVLDRWPCAGLAVAVIADGDIVWFHGHGLADVAARTPITEDTVFRIASHHQDLHRSRGDAAVGAGAGGPRRAGKRLPSHLPARPGEAEPVGRPPCDTSSRIPPESVTGGGSPICSNRASVRASARDDRGRCPSRDYYRRGLPVEVEPGTKWAYSNHGFAALGQIVEDVSGQPLDRYLRDRIFDPLGMEHTDLIRSERVRAAPGHRICAALSRPQAGRRPRSPDPGRGRDVLHHRRHRSLRRRPAEDGRQRARARC